MQNIELSNINWTIQNNLLDSINFTYYLKLHASKGHLAYEYNPLFNYRLTENRDSNGYLESDIENYNASDTEIEEAGTITNLDTELLNFSLDNPVQITPLYSYDGTVNLILNDGRNKPRMINSRFSVLEHNTYEVVDRIGNNDTNIYDSGDLFDIDTSLYKITNKLPTIALKNVSEGGEMKVGNYVFYFKYADADGNETDFIGESSLVSLFIGTDKDPFTILGGFRDLNSHKTVMLKITNTDSAYDYIIVYFSRTTGDINQAKTTHAVKIKRKFPIINGVCNITITGIEELEDIAITELNNNYFVANTAKTLAICQNRLFLANITKPDMLYKELTDLSLRIYPFYNSLDEDNLIGSIEGDYSDPSDKFGYYNTLNIYKYVGYWDEEIYRLGIVYIQLDNTLSNVYNIRGKNEIPKWSKNIKNLYSFTSWNGNYKETTTNFPYKGYSLYKVNNGTFTKDRLYIEDVDEETTLFIGRSDLENASGVIRISDLIDSSITLLKIYSIIFYIPDEVKEYLKSLGIKGYFFVRQKRIPTILGLALSLPVDTTARVPAVPYESENSFIETFLNSARLLHLNYNSRKYTFKTNATLHQAALLFPEYETNQAFYNLVLNGTKFTIRYSKINNADDYLHVLSGSGRLYAISNYLGQEATSNILVKLIAVGDSTKAAAIGDTYFTANAGDISTPYKFNYIRSNIKNTENWNYVRGLYGAYVGVAGHSVLPAKLVDIYIPGYSIGKLEEYFKIRYIDKSEYHVISDRYNIDDTEIRDIYRGDCYICNFTHRLNRNFADSSSPANDLIVDSTTWKDNYKIENDSLKLTDAAKINIGDVNAILLGTWITFKVRCSKNLCLRSIDDSDISEKVMFGHSKSFYPLSPTSALGAYKLSDSYGFNDGFSTTVSEKYFIKLPDVPFYKNYFANRILYSDISITDSFKNSFRVFNSGMFRDYSMEYGAILKILELKGNLLVVFEHGVSLLAVNERTVGAAGAGGPVFINANNILPETPLVLSDTFGTLWIDSIVKTENYVYGVDTVGKKIWRTNGAQFELISDFRMLKFLNDNISLGERENQVVVGIRNVKTHYNAAKHDVMFTFYDNTYGFEEKVWNLCYNELQDKFITFYSWVPSESQNIDNVFFTFNRDVAKYISKLGQTNYYSTNADGITLSKVVETLPYSNIIETNNWENWKAYLRLVNREIPNSLDDVYDVVYTYTLEKDKFGFYKYFEIIKDSDNNSILQFKNTVLSIKNNSTESTKTEILKIMNKFSLPVIYLNISCNVSVNYKVSLTLNLYKNIVEQVNDFNSYTASNANLYKSAIALTFDDILESSPYNRDLDGNIISENLLNFASDFWKHGLAGLIDIQEEILPCHWYGKQHPFEFEVVVADDPTSHKLFNNLFIIGNNSAPDSFHYEFIGDCFDFSWEKPNIYVRLELTKKLYLNLGSNILYSDDYTKIIPTRKKALSDKFYVKSTLFPLYYRRDDTLNEIEDYYKTFSTSNKDYSYLSGTEIVKEDSEYYLWEHVKALDTKDYGVLRGNMSYQEDFWKVQINPINILLKNEGTWHSDEDLSSAKRTKYPNGYPSIVLTTPPEDITSDSITKDDIPDDYGTVSKLSSVVDTSTWNNGNQIKIKDKFLKIRIRYTGENLTVVSALKTLYSISAS